MSEYQCAAVFWSFNIAGDRCARPGVIKAPSGKWYCADHTPQQHLKEQTDPAADNESTGDKS